MKTIELTDEQYSELLNLVESEVDWILHKIDKFKSKGKLDYVKMWEAELGIVANILNSIRLK